MKTKKILSFICSLIVGIIIIFLLRALFVKFYIAEPTIIQKEYSPDGMHIAYVYESNGGATTDFIYHLSVVKSDEKLKKGTGNTFVSGYDFSVQWLNNNELQINNTSSVEIYKQRLEVYDIKMKYRFLKEN